MKPLALTARNLRTWADLALELPTGIAAIIGPNGAGKSSIVEAIDLALFGKGAELTRATTRGFDDVELELTFEHAGETYRVRRVRRKAKTTLDLSRIELVDVTGFQEEPEQSIEGVHPLTRETAKETQAAIEELLGLSRQTFRASSFLAQGDGAAFTMAEPRERKTILLDALGVRLWDRLKAIATEYRGLAEKDLAELRARLHFAEQGAAPKAGLENELAETRAARATSLELLASWEEKLTEARQKIADVEKIAAERDGRLREVALLERQRDEALVRLERLRLLGNGELTEAARTELQARAALGEYAETILSLEAAHAQKSSVAEATEARETYLVEEDSRLRTESDSLVHELSAVKAELTDLTDCPTCGQALAGKPWEQASEALRARVSTLEDRQGMTMSRASAVAQELTRLAEERRLQEVELKGLVRAIMAEREVSPEALSNAASALADARIAERNLAELEARAEGTAAALAERETIEAELPKIEHDLADAKAAAEEVAVGDISAARSLFEAAEGMVAKERERVSECDRREAATSERLKVIDELETELERGREAERIAAEELELYNLAERAFGRDGIPALILETSAIPHLEAEANRIVSELGREYRFELRTQRETLAGGVQEVLDIVVHTESGEAVYEDFSGGERTRLDLSLRIALARLLAARRGADVKLLAIDEPAFLDAEGFSQLAKVLSELTGEFETILVVSHDELLRDAFDNSITVAGGGDTGEPSRLEEGSS